MGRDYVNVVYQVGVEAVPGTPVAANRRLPSISLMCEPDIRATQFRPNGARTNTISQIQRVMAGGNYEGPWTYNEFAYICANMFGDENGVSTSGLVNTWEFKPKTYGKDTGQKTFTLQFGDATHVYQVAYCQFINMMLAITLEGANVSGTFFAREMVSGSLSPNPVSIPQLPVNINEINVFFDTSFANIGTTKVTDALGFELEVTDKYKAKEVLNTDFPAFKESVDLPFTVNARLLSENNAQLQAIYNAMAVSGNPTRFLRCSAIGPDLGAGKYKIEIDAAVKLTGAPFEDADGVYSQRLELIAVDDASFGGFLKITVVNALSEL